MTPEGRNRLRMTLTLSLLGLALVLWLAARGQTARLDVDGFVIECDATRIEIPVGSATRVEVDCGTEIFSDGFEGEGR